MEYIVSKTFEYKNKMHKVNKPIDLTEEEAIKLLEENKIHYALHKHQGQLDPESHSVKSVP